MSNGFHGSHAAVKNGGKLIKVEIATICEWMKESWPELPQEIIVRTFKKFRISSVMEVDTIF